MLASDVTAQRIKFGEIKCAKLRVLGKDGEVLVTLGVGEHGGAVGVRGKDGESKAGLAVNKYGERVSVLGEAGRFTTDD